MDWTESLAAFELDQQTHRFSARTIDNRLELIGRLSRFLADTGVTSPMEVTQADLQKFLVRRRSNGQQLSAGTMQKERCDVRAFFSFLVDEGHRPDDPSARLKPILVPRRRPRPYAPEQIEALLSSGAYRRTRVMIMLGFYLGLRAHEIAKVHSDDIDLARMELAVEGKGGVVRYVPIHPLLQAELEHMPQSGYWFPARGTNKGEHILWGSVSNLLAQARKRAGIPSGRLTGHSLRHSYATQLLRGGNDVTMVQELLGHASLATTQIYVQVDETAKAAAVATLPVLQIPQHSGRRKRAA